MEQIVRIEIRDYKDLAIVATLAAIQGKYGKHYCYPSQKTILSLVAKYHGVVMKRRQLNYRLRRLENDGVIHRQKRHSRGEDGKIKFATTLTNLCTKVVNSVKNIAKSLRKVFGQFHVQNIAQYLLYHRDIRGQDKGNSVKSVDNSAVFVSADEFFRCNPQIQRPSFL